MKTNKGISLIVLVITIIVIIILIGAVILSLSKNNPIAQAEEAAFKESLNAYESELTLYISEQYATNPNTFNPSTVFAWTPQEVKNVLKNVTDKDAQNIRIVSGKLVYIGSDANQANWAKDMRSESDVPYVKNGMVLWYDGIYNENLGAHNSNSSANKGIWKDLSGNGNDGTLYNFDYTDTNGWGNSFLNYGLFTSYVMPARSMTYSSVQIVYQTDKSIWNYTIDARPYLSNGWAAVGYDIGSSYMLPYKDGITDRSTNTMPSNKVASITIKCNPTTGVLPTIGARYSQNESIMGKIYCVRIYDRLLTEQEIAQNFEIDKVRFGAN